MTSDSGGPERGLDCEGASDLQLKLLTVGGVFSSHDTLHRYPSGLSSSERAALLAADEARQADAAGTDEGTRA